MIDEQLSDEDISEILEHLDIESKRLNQNLVVQAAWIAHCFPQYDFDYVLHKMPAGLFTRLWSASQVIRLQTQMDIALACSASMSKTAIAALRKNNRELSSFARGLK